MSKRQSTLLLCTVIAIIVLFGSGVAVYLNPPWLEIKPDAKTLALETHNDLRMVEVGTDQWAI